MVENWIRVRYGDNCTLSFNDNVDVVLDVEDVEFLVKMLNGYLLGRCLVESA